MAIPKKTERDIERDMAGNALEGMSEERKVRVRKRCAFRSIRPAIPITSGHLNRGIRPPLFSGCEA